MIGGSVVEVGDYVFRLVHSVTIKSSWKTLGDTCVIELPNIKDILAKQNVIKGGDRVVVKLGYNEDVVEEFRGYVQHVSSTWPYTIHCLDDLYPLTRDNVTMSWESTTLKDVLKYLVPSAALAQVPTITLKGFRLNRVTKAAALQKLRDEYGLVAYFREGKLYCGLAYGETGLGSVAYHFEKNLPKRQTGVDFVRAADIHLKVKAISMLPDNTTITVEAGDANGEERTLHYYDKTKAELKVLAEDAVNLLKYDGLRGTIATKGLPRCKHGQVAELVSDVYPERTGNYFIDSVTTTFNGSTGYSRAVELGRKSNAALIQAQ